MPPVTSNTCSEAFSRNGSREIRTAQRAALLSFTVQGVGESSNHRNFRDAPLACPAGGDHGRPF
jgi:hypothetical protein